MRVLNLTLTLTGGAGIAALRLHRNLAEHGVNSRMYVMDGPVPDAADIRTLEPAWGFRVADKPARAVTRKIYDANYYFPLGFGCSAGQVIDACRSDDFTPDVIVCHWMSRFLSAESVRAIADHFNVPVVLHVMDMGPLTGGCHYSFDCTGYQASCGRCPAIRPSHASDLSHRRMTRRIQALKGTRLAAVVTCEHVALRARSASVLRGAVIEKIYYGIDPAIFSPGDQTQARARLGLPADARLLFAGAQNAGNVRKGAQFLQAAVEQIAIETPNKPTILALAGDPPSERWEAGGPGVEIRWLGYLDLETSLVDAYRAADAFVCASIEDAGPMMISEAAMCGTPVVSFDMGVARDLVHTGQTGYRAALRDTNDLAQGMRTIRDAEPGALATMRANARALAMQELTPTVQAHRFIALFERLTSTARPVGSAA